jgi:hypothetical protein
MERYRGDAIAGDTQFSNLEAIISAEDMPEEQARETLRKITPQEAEAMFAAERARRPRTSSIRAAGMAARAQRHFKSQRKGGTTGLSRVLPRMIAGQGVEPDVPVIVDQKDVDRLKKAGKLKHGDIVMDAFGKLGYFDDSPSAEGR